MKKIIVILFCFYVGSVSALEYSEYTPFSDYSDKEMKSDEFTDVKVERRYKYYKLVRKDGPYERKNINNEDYPFVDDSDYMYTLESNYLDEKPLDEDGRIISSHTLYHYLKADNIDYIKFSNSSITSFLTYSDLNILYNGENITYDVVYNDADESFINPGGNVEIKFDKEIDIRYLEMTFNMKLYSGNRSDLYVILGNNRKNVGQARYIFLTDAVRNIYFDGIDTDIFEDAFIDYYSERLEETRPAIVLVDSTFKYTYKDILYRKYNLVKEYSKDYLTDKLDDYIYKDEEKYKDYYAYRTRSVINKKTFNDLVNNDDKCNYENNVYKILDKPFKVKNDYSYVSLPLQRELSNKYNEKKLNYNVLKIKNREMFVYYFSYVLIFLVILILVLSKLYKKYIKRAKV